RAPAPLVAAHEAISERQRTRLTPMGSPLIERLKRDASALVLTSVIASLATAPFAAYHFHRWPPLPLVATLAAMPAISFVVMPMALATALLMPFGLEAFPLKVMA